MKNNLSKHYDKFTNKERINLTLAALVRGDGEEFARLCKSCERFTYSKPDINYSGKMERLTIIGFWYQIRRSWLALQALEKIATEDAYKGKLDGYKECFCDIVKNKLLRDNNLTKDHPIFLEVEKFSSACRKKMFKAEKDLHEITSKFVAVYEALKLFCKEVDVDFKNMIAWATDLGDDSSEKPEELPSCIKADNDVLEKALREFRGLWE